MENTTTDFAQALIDDLQDENLFDFEEVMKTEPEQSNTYENIRSNKENQVIEFQAVASANQPEIMSASLPTQKSANTQVSQKVLEVSHQVSLEYKPNFQEETQEKVVTDDYKKAISEISSLKTIEQIFFGVEQEQLKLNSIPFDAVAINMALLGFQKGSVEDEERVYSEIEKWQCYLLDRDEQISLKDLRTYCETTKPKLNPRAMLTLAEFYQNVSRSKFEMLLTRTFSQEDEETERRDLLCDDEEISYHLREICPELDLPGLDYKWDLLKKFGEDLKEFESINGMLATDYFGNYQTFKQELGDLFFDSRILGLIVQNNVQIGNHFVTLVEKERAAGSFSNIFNKESFGVVFEESISEVVCKTIHLDKIKINTASLKQKKTETQLKIEKHRSELKAKNAQLNTSTLVSKQKEEDSGSGRVMKMILLCLVLTAVIVGVGYFMIGGGLKDGDQMSEADIIQNESNKNEK
jgi:hypothetical protein